MLAPRTTPRRPPTPTERPPAPPGSWHRRSSTCRGRSPSCRRSCPRTCANRSHPDAEPQQFDTVVEGRRSYELGLAAGIPNAYAHLEHCVFSRALTASPDPGVRLVATDPVEKVRELKSRPGRKIWSVGGAQLAAALRPEIDELITKLHPVVAGAGVPLFDGDFRPERFELVSADPHPSGIVHLTYRKR